MASANAERVFLDTNILTRATVITAPLHEAALAAVERFWEAEAELWISQQVIREYLATVTRPQTYAQPVPMARALEQARRFRVRFHVAEGTVAVLDRLLELLAAVPMGGRQVHDANVVATMLAYNIRTLCTHNVADFERFSDYITVLPLEDKP